jgi:hypothetical protein
MSPVRALRGRERRLHDIDRTGRLFAAASLSTQIEDADQTSGFVHYEHDEPKVADVRDPPPRHSGRRTEHRIVGVVADPGQQRDEHVERLLGEAVHVPERTGLQIRPVAHAWVKVHGGTDPPTGREIRLRKTCKTERAALIELGRLLEQAAAGRQPETNATVAELMDRYAEVADWDLSTRKANEALKKSPCLT